MTYEEAARILSLYATKLFSPDLQKAIMMGADALFKRAAGEKAINYRECAMDDPNDEEVDISEKENDNGNDHRQE